MTAKGVLTPRPRVGKTRVFGLKKKRLSAQKWASEVKPPRVYAVGLGDWVEFREADGELERHSDTVKQVVPDKKQVVKYSESRGHYFSYVDVEKVVEMSHVCWTGGKQVGVMKKSMFDGLRRTNPEFNLPLLHDGEVAVVPRELVKELGSDSWREKHGVY